MMKNNLKRIWKNYNKWEDFRAGFFNAKQKYSDDMVIRVTKTLTSNEFYEIGIKLFFEWENSINHNLSFTGSNRKSYLGQAVCCFLYGLSAKTTAEIFTKMNDVDKKIANNIAQKLIEEYEKNYYKEVL